MDKLQRLAALADAEQSYLRARTGVSDCAVNARLSGASWREIGDVLGITKQAAYARFADKLPYQFPLPAAE